MAIQGETGPGLIEAVNGGHLHWLDFRETVLQPFRIRCSPTLRSERLPTTFLARLQASQGNLAKYDGQTQAWRLDVKEGRGLISSPLFPPNLIPRGRDATTIRRVMSPRMSREGLPLKATSPRSSLYELPTASPAFVTGFNMDIFEKPEQALLAGGLSLSGTVVDFDNGEVMPGKPMAVPILAFHKFETKLEADIETARNGCAITGAQCLRGQQQLFHKAFGLQQVSNPPITFTCALNNDHAIINCHYIDDDGHYTMVPLCRFNLNQDEHFKTFQAWIEAIESWALLHLLPRVKGAIHSILRSNPSPPPSPTPNSAGLLCIDTNSDSVSAILNALRRLWPTVRWQNDLIGETPINSSIAQCGTPLTARQIRNFALHASSINKAVPLSEKPHEFRSYSSISQRMADLTPICTDIPLSARPRSRQSIHQRRFSVASSLRSGSDSSTTPISPCRPPTLSPCTPGPEAPVSAKSPMLVLQKRLEVAMNEIQELRVQVEGLQGQLNGRTEVLERRLDIIVERQAEASTKSLDTGGPLKKKGGGTWAKQLEALVEDEQDIETPVAKACLGNHLEDNTICPAPISPTTSLSSMPGSFSISAQSHVSQLDSETCLSQQLVVRVLAVMIKDERANFLVMVVGVLVMSITGVLDTGGFCANAAFALGCNESVCSTVWQFLSGFTALIYAVKAYDLEQIEPDKSAAQPAAEETVTLLLR